MKDRGCCIPGSPSHFFSWWLGVGFVCVYTDWSLLFAPLWVCWVLWVLPVGVALGPLFFVVVCVFCRFVAVLVSVFGLWVCWVLWALVPFEFLARVVLGPCRPVCICAHVCLGFLLCAVCAPARRELGIFKPMHVYAQAFGCVQSVHLRGESWVDSQTHACSVALQGAFSVGYRLSG